MWMTVSGFISLWCFWAAIVSVVIDFHLRTDERAAGPRERNVNACVFSSSEPVVSVLRSRVAAAESEVLEHVVVADVDVSRATAAVERCADARFVARALDASDTAAITALAAHERVDVVVNACDPRLNPSIFAAAFDANCHYLDMAMTLSGARCRIVRTRCRA